jgi:hypothetical protein
LREVNVLSFEATEGLELSEPVVPRACQAEPTELSTRRALMRLGGLTAGVLGLLQEAEAQRITPPPDATQDYKLVRRMTYGITAAEMNQYNRLGFDGYRDYYLRDGSINDSLHENDIAARYPRLSQDQWQLFEHEDDWYTNFQLVEATIRRMAFSRRQLFQRITEFWHDHFNVTIHKVPAWMMVDYDKTIRRHALGKFPDLLRAVAQHPAMLVFLDNVENFGAFGNVNFARELLELHSVSVEGGYTPADIRNVARCFSGWGYTWWPGNPKHGKFEFWDWAHDYGEKTVFGVRIPAGGGKSDGDKVLDIVLAHPMTSRFICTKLAKYFVSYDPPARLVDAMVAEYLRTGGDIKAILKVMFNKSDIAKAKQKYKRPLHLVVGGLRQSNATLNGDQWSLVYEHLSQAGQMPWTWSFPDGFPDKVSFWAGLILPRWNYALMLPQNFVWGVEMNIPSLLAGARGADNIVKKINELYFGHQLRTEDVTNLRNFLAADPNSDYRIKATFALALALPAYQWY